MKKSYHCKFGTNLTVTELRDIFQNWFDVDFELHESSYVGEYYKYSGMFADKLTVHPKGSASSDSLSDEDYKKFSCLIYLDNTIGKNADKLSKTNYMKHHMLQRKDIVLLYEKILEE